MCIGNFEKYLPNYLPQRLWQLINSLSINSKAQMHRFPWTEKQKASVQLFLYALIMSKAGRFFMYKATCNSFSVNSQYPLAIFLLALCLYWCEKPLSLKN